MRNRKKLPNPWAKYTLLSIIPEFVVSTPANVSSAISMTTRVKYKNRNGPIVSKIKYSLDYRHIIYNKKCVDQNIFEEILPNHPFLSVEAAIASTFQEV